ncbi:MAG: hypothetical protein BWK73_29320 [Thiothrix lacustris]|uniref:Glycosyltransferase RgtA/B/C/D-like domain-containing protein n=1 Tax=Thiothrix lacustris TaxID=525917 RepID=A0A1Y1QJ76_9GAMM|nr:MAG: hypothetical protein BWK73_29320 [Thiothrix lacustris]
MNIRKDIFFLLSLTSIVFLSQTTGFDLYSHSISYYYYEQSIDHAYLFFDKLIFPRYGLLSILYELASRMGMPIALFAFSLTIIPNYIIIKSIITKEIFRFHDLLTISFILILNLFYSGLTLVLLYLISYLIIKDRKLLIGGLLHPIGILIFALGALFTRILIQYTIILILFFTLIFFTSDNQVFYAQAHNDFKKTIDFSTIALDLQDAIERKKQEIFGGMLIISLGFFLTRRKNILSRILKIFNLKIKKLTLLKGSVMLTLLLSVYMALKPSPNFITAILSADINQVIYVSWFDWGERDTYMTHAQLYFERYKYVDSE